MQLHERVQIMRNYHQYLQPVPFPILQQPEMIHQIRYHQTKEVSKTGLSVSITLDNIGDNFALFEPVHGAAFDIAGQNIANPSSFLLSIKMMLDWLGAKHNDSKCFEVGQKLESTIFDLVKSGVKTKDIGGDKTTSEFTKHITDNL